MKQRLELDRNKRFHRGDWIVQRIGWTVWGGVLAAGLAGLIGSGPLSSRRTAAPDGSLQIKYDRFVRYHAPSTLELLVVSAGETEDVSLQVGQEFLDSIKLHRIQPEPAESSLGSNGTRLTFKRQDRAQKAIVTIHFEHEALGAVTGKIRVQGHETARFHQFVYP
jgi:hypothetical protein